jgi:hypothetical protein
MAALFFSLSVNPTDKAYLKYKNALDAVGEVYLTIAIVLK